MDGHLTSSTGDGTGEEVGLSPLVPDRLVEEKLDHCVLESSVLHLGKCRGDKSREDDRKETGNRKDLKSVKSNEENQPVYECKRDH